MKIYMNGHFRDGCSLVLQITNTEFRAEEETWVDARDHLGIDGD